MDTITEVLKQLFGNEWNNNVLFIIPTLEANSNIVIRYNVEIESGASWRLVNLVSIIAQSDINPTETVPYVVTTVDQCSEDPEKDPTTWNVDDRSVAITNNVLNFTNIS